MHRKGLSEMDEKQELETKEEIKPVEQEGETPPAINEELESLRKALKEANKESAARRKKLEEYEKAEETRKLAELSEIEKAKALLETEQAQRAKLEAELQKIQTEKDFSKATKVLQVEYANEAAETDALEHLTKAGVTSETMESMLKQLSIDRPHWFKQRVEKPVIDSQDKGTLVNGEMTEARKQELKQRIPSL